MIGQPTEDGEERGAEAFPLHDGSNVGIEAEIASVEGYRLLVAGDCLGDLTGSYEPISM